MQTKAAEAHADPHADAHADADAHAAPPIPRDPELPTVSDTTLAFFAGGALFVTAVALVVLLD